MRYCLVLLIAGLSASRAAAFSIESVSFTPGPPAASTPVTMIVRVATPSASAGLYAPTQVVRTGSHVRVDIYPTGGMLQMIDGIAVSAPLGTLDVGDYTYEVEIHPAWPVGWGTRYVQGTFSVLPEITLSLSGTNLFLRWPASATNFVLETACECPSGQWTEVTNTAVRLGLEMVVTNDIQSSKRFYRLRRR